MFETTDTETALFFSEKVIIDQYSVRFNLSMLIMYYKKNANISVYQ